MLSAMGACPHRLQVPRRASRRSRGEPVASCSGDDETCSRGRVYGLPPGSPTSVRKDRAVLARIARPLARGARCRHDRELAGPGLHAFDNAPVLCHRGTPDPALPATRRRRFVGAGDGASRAATDAREVGTSSNARTFLSPAVRFFPSCSAHLRPPGARPARACASPPRRRCSHRWSAPCTQQIFASPRSPRFATRTRNRPRRRRIAGAAPCFSPPA